MNNYIKNDCQNSYTLYKINMNFIKKQHSLFPYYFLLLSIQVSFQILLFSLHISFLTIIIFSFLIFALLISASLFSNYFSFHNNFIALLIVIHLAYSLSCLIFCLYSNIFNIFKIYNIITITAILFDIAIIYQFHKKGNKSV